MRKYFAIFSIAVTVVLFSFVIAILYIKMRVVDKSQQLAQFDAVVRDVLADSNYLTQLTKEINEAHKAQSEVRAIDSIYKNTNYGIGTVVTSDNISYVIVYQTFHAMGNNGVDKVAVIRDGKLIGVYGYHLCCSLSTFQAMPPLKNQDELVKFLSPRNG